MVSDITLMFWCGPHADRDRLICAAEVFRLRILTDRYGYSVGEAERWAQD